MKTLITKLKTWLIIAVLGATVYAGSTFDAGQGEPLAGSGGSVEATTTPVMKLEGDVEFSGDVEIYR